MKTQLQTAADKIAILQAEHEALSEALTDADAVFQANVAALEQARRDVHAAADAAAMKRAELSREIDEARRTLHGPVSPFNQGTPT